MPNPNAPAKRYGKVASKVFGRVIKANPVNAAILYGGGLLWAYWYQKEVDLADYGFVHCWGSAPVKEAVRLVNSVGGSANVDNPCLGGIHSILSGQVPTAAADEFTIVPPPSNSRARYQAIYYGPYNPLKTRMTFMERWSRGLAPNENPVDVPPYSIGYDPVLVPEAEPWVPWAPPDYIPIGEPVPVAPPLRRPDYDQSNPPAPQLRPGRRPSIDVDGHSPPKPDTHHERPPKPPEKERKKRLTNATAGAWQKLLGAGANTLTEYDDFVSAIYKGLNWRVRRWRGRDGVWRDRDINSATRTQRIYSAFGELNIETAIKEVVKNQVEDALYGAVGNALKKRAKALGQEGLWSGSRGFQSGGSLTREQWEKLYEKLRKEQGARVPASRTYTVNNYNRDTNQWEREKKTYGSRTTIPWYRHQSEVLRRAKPHSAEWWKLSQRDKGKRVLTRHYYARNPSFAPDAYNPERDYNGN